MPAAAKAETKTVTPAEEAVEVEALLDPETPDELVPTEPDYTPLAAGLPPIFKLADMLWTSARQFIPKHYRSAAEVVAAILTGQELGIGAMTSLRVLHPVNGKIEMSTQLMLALINRNGVVHEWVVTSNKKATIRLSRPGFKPFEYSFTEEMAKVAGLLPGKKLSAWKKHPDDMLRWRCAAAAIRAYCPEYLLGAYAPGELDGIVEAPASWRTVPRDDVAEYDEDEDDDAPPGKKPADDPDEH